MSRSPAERNADNTAIEAAESRRVLDLARLHAANLPEPLRGMLLHAAHVRDQTSTHVSRYESDLDSVDVFDTSTGVWL